MNLLKNPHFDEGHYHQNNIGEIVVPKEWYLYWIDKEIFKGASAVAYRPESVVWNIKDAPAHEKSLFFLSGDYCWKYFQGQRPRLLRRDPGCFRPDSRRDVSFQRESLSRHRDRPCRREEESRPQTDMWAAEARAGWSTPDTPWPHAEDGDVAWHEWFNMQNQNLVFGAYNDVWVEFAAPASGEVRVWVECKAKWGFENNWFIDSFSLEQVDGETEPITPITPVEPPITPVEPPVPTSGRGAPRTIRAHLHPAPGEHLARHGPGGLQSSASTARDHRLLAGRRRHRRSRFAPRDLRQP